MRKQPLKVSLTMTTPQQTPPLPDDILTDPEEMRRHILRPSRPPSWEEARAQFLAGQELQDNEEEQSGNANT